MVGYHITNRVIRGLWSLRRSQVRAHARVVGMTPRVKQVEYISSAVAPSSVQLDDKRQPICYSFFMKKINWNAEKNQMLMSQRGLSFEDAVFALQANRLLDDLKHPNSDKYPNQRILIIEIDGYACLVPYIENDQEIFLKTVIPGRKATQKYLKRAL